MLRIIKDNNEKIVTKGAYEDFYKHLGYELVKDKNQPLKKEVETKKDEETQKKTKNYKEYTRK